MAAPAIDHAKPDFATAVDANMDSIRDNEIWHLIAFASAAILVPGWNSVPSGADLAKPDDVVLTGPGGRKVRITYTYTGDDVTGIDIDYDKNLGAGYEQITLGTGTITYDGSGNFSGCTWA